MSKRSARDNLRLISRSEIVILLSVIVLRCGSGCIREKDAHRYGIVGSHRHLNGIADDLPAGRDQDGAPRREISITIGNEIAPNTVSFVNKPMPTRLETFIEEAQVLGRDLVDKVKALIHEGNVQRIIIKDERGNTFIEIPVTVAAIGAIAAPVLAAVGAISALVAKFRIVIERVDRSTAPDGTERKN